MRNLKVKYATQNKKNQPNFSQLCLMSKTIVAIMAGGVGSRFWPGSREARPKQFLDMLGTGKSLLRLTFERFLPLVPASDILVVTNTLYKDLVLEQLPEITAKQVLCEPSRNNTGPSVAYTALHIEAMAPGANMVVAPSDHLILKESEFLDKIKEALEFASGNKALITLGLQPTRPDTGYGYIQMGELAGGNNIHRVVRFTEKPELAVARQFVDSGEYVWNAGIFIWNTRSILSALKAYVPELMHMLESDAYHTPGEQAFIDAHYPKTPNISIDFAVMEKADNVYTLPADIGWSDLGTWASLHAECERDAYDNVVQGDNVLEYDCDNCFVRAPKGKLVVLKELSDYIVVDEGDVLLVYPKSKEQEIKQVTAEVKARFGGKFL